MSTRSPRAGTTGPMEQHSPQPGAAQAAPGSRGTRPARPRRPSRASPPSPAEMTSAVDSQEKAAKSPPSAGSTIGERRSATHSDKVSEQEEYTKVILLLRTELGKAHEMLRQREKNGGEDENTLEKLRAQHRDETAAANKIILLQVCVLRLLAAIDSMACSHILA